MSRPNLDISDEDLGIALVRAAQCIVFCDADRDHDNKSDLLVDQALEIFDLLKAAALRFGADYEQMTFGEARRDNPFFSGMGR